MALEESISLEETNKIRIKLGLKPLVDDNAPTDTKEKEANDNFAARKEEEDKAKRASELVSRIEKNKNKRERNRRLVGTTLGAADEDGDDTLKWIRKNKKREKELARKRQTDIEERETFDPEAYTEKDLAGLKVSHDLDILQEGEDRILTLKDSRILDNEEDELHNVDMAEDESDERRKELKTKRKDYTGYDDEEFVEGAVGVKRNVLSKYDEDIDGVPEKGFRLGGPTVSDGTSRKSAAQDTALTVNRSLLTMDYAKNQEISDYVQEGDVGFKKPKTKKKRSTRRPEADTDAAPATLSNDPAGEAVQMEVDVKPELPNLDTNFVDDDELQAMLTQARRRKVRKAKKITPEDIAQQVAEERAAENAAPDDIGRETTETGGLTFDDTSEFVRAITYTPAVPKPQLPSAPIIIKVDTSAMRDAEGDVSMPPAKDGDEALSEFGAGDAIKTEEDEDVDAIMLAAIEDAIASSTQTQDETDEPDMGTSSKLTYSSGMGAALSLLRQQGAIAAPSDETLDRERTQINKDQWLAQQRHRLAQRELEKVKSRSSGKDQATREYENRMREQQEARESMELFKDYKPDVDIKYHDEFGRTLTSKEAWKALSHKFHGKGSGRMKTEKLLKKIADEKKREAMGSGDTPLSMNAAFQIRQEKAGQAHMVLSVGNRGAVPQATEFLDSGIIAKKEKGKGKKKDAKAPAPAIDMTGFTANNPTYNPLGANSAGAVISAAPTTAPLGEAASSTPPPQMAKSGFSRITTEAAPNSGDSTPVANDNRGKVQFGFGFGIKRKAGDESEGTPSKRR